MVDTFKIEVAKVIAVDPSGAVRQLLTDVLRTQGFEKMQAMSSVKDVMSNLEVEKVDLIVTPLMLDQNPNGLQLLKLVSETPELKGTRIAFLLEEAEFLHLPLAFSLGLLAWFPKPYNKDSLTQEIAKFKEAFSTLNWDSTRLAASNCIKRLSDDKKYQSQIDLSRALINLYPGDANYVLNMAKPLFELGKKDEAKTVLHQVKLLNKSLDTKVDEVAKDLFGDAGIGAPGGKTEDVLNLGTCAIIDPDKKFSGAIKEILQKIGVQEILEFQDGNAAWIWLQENPFPGVLFMEWRIPELTGPYLIQRIRKKFPSAVVIVVSALIDKDDEALVQEMGVSELIQKPIETPQFLERLIKAMREERLPTDVAILERKIRQALASSNTSEAASLMEKYLAEASISPLRKMKIEAEFAYYEGNYTKARNLAAESLRGSADSVVILNLLGKTLMQLHDYAASLRCFEKAQDLSPKNIQRLCSIAEANSELHKAEDSQSAIESAKDQDGENPEIVQTEAKIAVSMGDTEKAKEIMSQLDSLSELISYMNNKAISLARCGKINEGIEIYRRTISSVPENKGEIKAIVIYNLALAFVRMGEQGDAAETLSSAIELGNTRVLKKSKSLKMRLEKAMQVGEVITLASDAAAATDAKKPGAEEIGSAKGPEADKGGGTSSVAEVHRAVSATVSIKPGELCCFRLFNYSDPLSPQVAGWFEKLPRFKIRLAIAREESRGADKLMTAG